MGSYFSKFSSQTLPPAVLDVPHNSEYKAGLSSYEKECRVDPDLQSFDASLQTRTHRVINSLASGVEVRALSIDSMKEVTGCLLEMNQEVVKVILDSKQDVWKNRDLFKLVEEYFENSLQTLDFCTALDKCLKRVRDSQMIINVALKRFDEQEGTSENKYARTLKELGNFRSAGNPFTEEFFGIFKSVYQHHLLMLKKLEMQKKKLDKKLKAVRAWRKVSCMIFASTLVAIIVCSLFAATMAAPIVASAVAAVTALPLASVGKWFDTFWKSYEDVLKGHKDIIRTMQSGTYIAIKDLDGIRGLVDQLVGEMESLLLTAEFAVTEDQAVKVGMEEIKNMLAVFMDNIEQLTELADRCSRDIRRARTVVLQRIIKDDTNS